VKVSEGWTGVAALCALFWGIYLLASLAARNLTWHGLALVAGFWLVALGLGLAWTWIREVKR
jgi:hypothetical protein